MEGIEYIYELCENLPRCGPGDNEHTRKAFDAISSLPQNPLILDIGCGTGMQTLELARITGGQITALDNYQGFLNILMQNAQKEGLDKHISCKNQSMLEMDFESNAFDLIWSEGALYNMGFTNGLNRSHELLKVNGYLAVTELVYISDNPPADVAHYFEKEYPDIKDIQMNIESIINAGFELITHFTLPESAWFDHYFTPIEKALPKLIKKYTDNESALGIFEGFQYEVDFYKKYSNFYGYEFFIMKKVDE